MKTLVMPRAAFAAALLFIAGQSLAEAATHNVNSQATLNTALGVANPGDQIVIADNTYSNLQITITRAGTLGSEIYIRAATPGGVTLNGDSWVIINAQYIVVHGLKFVDVLPNSPANVDHVVTFTGASNSRLTQCQFVRCGWSKWSHIVRIKGGSDYVQVDHNSWIDLNGQGVGVEDETGSQDAHIHHNYFNGAIRDNGDNGTGNGNGNEPIQLGQGTHLDEDMRAVVEYNLMENMAVFADPEMISVKTGGNTIRYNTLRNTHSAYTRELTLRYAANCVVEGNFLFGVGIRVFGNDHKVLNNYISGARRGVNLPGGNDVDYPATTNVLVANNTIIDPSIAGIVLSNGNGSLLSNITVKNNLVQGTANSAHWDVHLYDQTTTFTGITYNTNLANLIVDGTPPGGQVIDADWNYAVASIKADPLLVDDGTLLRLPTGTSPAKAAGTAETEVTLDVDGQTRSGALDVGADEYAATALLRRPLTTADVGPAWLGGPGEAGGTTGTKVAVPGAQTSASTNDGNVPANAVDGSLSTRWSGDGDGAWLQYDLGASYTVTHLKVAVHLGNTRQTAFHLQLSENGSTWTDVAGSASSPLISSGTTLSLETYNTPDARGRYVRFVGHGNTSNMWNSPAEVEVWGHSPTLTAVADTYAHGGFPNTTYGTDAIIGAKDTTGTTYDRVGFIKFDLSKLTFTPSAATLVLTTDLSTEAGTLGINQCTTDSWTEAALTFTNKPATGTSITTTSLTAGVVADKSINVSSYVSSQFSGDATKLVSFALTGPNAVLAIKSRDSAAGEADAPTLVLTP